jgi:tetratricopeptide (TPR) repeat protein
MAHDQSLSSQDGYFNLGSFQRSVTTSSEDAQRWFNRGLVWCYAFNHEEASECFERAIAHDSTCAMTYWGLAYALGPNYNKPWEFFDEKELDTIVHRTSKAAAQARALAPSSLPVEQAIINALQFRYPEDKTEHDYLLWNKNYADAMRLVYEMFQDDLDVAALYAEALMNLTPWQLWDIRSGEPAPGACTIEAKMVLDRALAYNGGLAHPGLLHLYIHLMEMSAVPEVALPVADRLRGLVPDAGHLNHMPSHLDILCGGYQQAITSNLDAIEADTRFSSRSGPLNFYTLYICHNYHFCIYAAMFSGQSRVALNTAAELEATISEDLLRIESPPMADWLEAFLSVRLHVLVRFGLWDDILGLELPRDQELYCVTTAMMHYAKGVASAATRKVEEAKKELALFHEALKHVPISRTLFNNKCVDILAIANAMLQGELAYRQGNFDLAFDQLRRSIALDDALPYDEPWGWMQPTRHAYGALLLEQNHVEKAAEVYSADLGMDDTLPRPLRHPGNVWSLHGYHECLKKLGRTTEAGVIEENLAKALDMADVSIKSSCFCRLSAAAESNPAVDTRKT